MSLGTGPCGLHVKRATLGSASEFGMSSGFLRTVADPVMPQSKRQPLATRYGSSHRIAVHQLGLSGVLAQPSAMGSRNECGLLPGKLCFQGSLAKGTRVYFKNCVNAIRIVEMSQQNAVGRNGVRGVLLVQVATSAFANAA